VVDEWHPQAGRDYPGNWHELLEWFPDDGSCLRYLERRRWGERFVCRFCGAVDGGWWQMADGLRRCAVCRSETSVTAGTIFAGTRTPLTSWFAAVWYVVNQKQGVSALGLQRVLGLGSYRTAWTWLHKLRRAMVRPGRDLLDGAVEVDETLVGGVKPGKRGRGAEGKALVLIAVERREGGPGRVRMQRIPNAAADTLTDFVLEHVARGSEVHTDGCYLALAIGMDGERDVLGMWFQADEGAQLDAGPDRWSSRLASVRGERLRRRCPRTADGTVRRGLSGPAPGEVGDPRRHPAWSRIESAVCAAGNRPLRSRRRSLPPRPRHPTCECFGDI